MLVRVTVFLFILELPVISARNWTNDDVNALTLNIAEIFNLRCVLLTYPESMSLEQIRKKASILHNMSRVSKSWHPMVGWTTFDLIVQEKVTNRRTDCNKPLYFILEYESLKTDLEVVSKLVYFTNAVWLVIFNEKVDLNFFSNMRINVNSEFYIIMHDEETGRVIFSEVYAVGQDNAMAIVDLGFWTWTDGLVFMSGRNYFNRQRNLRRQTIRTVSSENWPITSYKINQFSKGMVMDGFYARVWYELEDLMNFTTRYVKNKKASSGIEVANGKYNGLIGMTQQNEVDVLLTELTMTPRRSKVLEFVQPFIRTRYQVYFRFNGFVIEWTSIFRPFGTEVWIAISTVIIVCTLVLYWINSKTNQQAIGEYFRLKLSESFFLILQTFCFQGTFNVPRKNAFRICLVFSYLTAAVILPSYSAALISALTKKTEVKPFDTMEGLLKAKTPLLVWPNSADYEMFSKAETPLYQALFKLVNPESDMKQMADYGHMLEYICGRSTPAAIFGVETGMQVMLRKLQLSGDRCRIIQFTQGVFSISQTFGFVKNSPFSHLINNNLLRFRERGLIKRYEKQYMPTWSKKDDPVFFEVTMAETATVFSLLLSGIILSLFILFSEYFYHRVYESSTAVVNFKYTN